MATKLLWALPLLASLAIAQTILRKPDPQASASVDREYVPLNEYWASFAEPLAQAQVDPEKPCVVPLWQHGAPGFEHKRHEEELAESYWVRNVDAPSLTAFLPSPEKATGEAIIICPGGGHFELVFGIEGTQPAQWFQKQGVAAFVLKYRLARGKASPYKVSTHGKEDAQRAVRVVRSLPESLGIHPGKVGMLGFSAGGDIVSLAAHALGDGNEKAPDPIDRANALPSFIVLGYPGIRGTPRSLPAHSPPAFLLAAKDDRGAHANIMTLAKRYKDANRPHEALSFPSGGHGFSIGLKSKVPAIQAWPDTFLTWLRDHFQASGKARASIPQTKGRRK